MARIRPPVTRQYIQRLISEMRRDGLVEHLESQDDRRTKIIRLTERGRQVVVSLLPAEREFVKPLTANKERTDLDAVRRVLLQIAETLEEE